MEAIRINFRQCTESLLASVPYITIEILNSICDQLVLKMSHTISNDFLKNVTTLESIKDKKLLMPRCHSEMN